MSPVTPPNRVNLKNSSVKEMALMQAFGESGHDSPHLDDPFDWTVHQVVRSLCNPESRFLSWRGGVYLPDPEGFAEVLREEQIDGEALLTAVTMDVLRNDLGIRAIGTRTKIVNLIQRLQHQSIKYQEMLERKASRGGRFSSVISMSRNHSPPFLLPQHPGVNAQNLAPKMIYDQPTIRPHPEQTPLSPNSFLSAADIPLMTENSSNTCGVEGNQGEFSSTDRSTQQRETYCIDEKGRQRRRVAPIVVTQKSLHVEAPISADLANEELSREDQAAKEDGLKDIVCQAEEQAFRVTPVDGEIIYNTVSGAQHIDGMPTSGATSEQAVGQRDLLDLPGHKNIKPTLIEEPAEGDLCTPSPSGNISGLAHPAESAKNSLSSKPSTSGKRSKRAAHQIYFGPSALRIDDLFYSDVELGEIIEDEAQTPRTKQQEMSLDSSNEVSDAQRLWVNSRMKYFFRSVTSKLIVKDKGDEVGIIPYPDRLGKRNHPLSMTLLFRREDGICKVRRNRLDWSAPASLQNASNAFKVLDPSMVLDNDDGSWDALEKWNYVDGDKVLPAYGDSGSEGGFDPETYKEIEAESGKIERSKGSSRTPQLTSEEVDAAIDDAVTQFRNEWQVKKYPKIQRRAWQIWARARRDRTTESNIETIFQRITDLERRLLSLRTEIGKAEWYNVDQVRRQSKSMQPTIFECEECQCKLAILKSKSAPQKLPPAARAARRTREREFEKVPLQHGEETPDFTESSADDEEETDHDLDDFIDDNELDVNTEPIGLGHEDINMADVEDASLSDTLANSPAVAAVERNEVGLQKTLPATPTHIEPAQTEITDFIDLTQVSDSSEAPPTKAVPTRIVTPPIIIADEDSDARFARSRGIKPEFKQPPKIDDIPLFNLDHDSDSDMLLREPVQLPEKLPPLNDIKNIKKLNATKLVEKQDRKRLLVWLIAHTDKRVRNRVFEYIHRLDMKTCLDQIKDGLREMKTENRHIAGKDQETSDGVLQLAAWYVGWTIPVRLNSKGVSLNHIKTTLENDEGFDRFYEFLLECLRNFKRSSSTKSTPSKRRKKEKQNDLDLSDSSALVDLRNIASQSQETIQKRDAALLRMREDTQRVQLRARRDARRRELMPRLAALSALQTEASEVILNPGKRDDQDLIYLNSEFGRGAQLKPHQKEGLQFMWREITGDHDDLQGCLLAQTMGLGKTIQVIALLVAISDAANSHNENIRSQLPIKLHACQTLVLCPPGLIENWWDEFLMWPPTSNHLGELRKVSASLKPDERINEILAWEQEGGILLLGYHTFRDLVQNKQRLSKNNKALATTAYPQLNEEQHRKITSALLEKPNIVVADEAHEFKNLKSHISQAINQVKCKSRIALTGSPLSNNLGEYFATINWISPGYLGTESDFKTVYEDPIQRGLYEDVSPAQYRESRKRLKALELELEPKIHRADLSALHGNLHGKSEFVVRVPLTAFQDRLYRDVLSGTNGLPENTDRQKNTVVWAYLAILQLICNHPGSFRMEHNVSANHSSTDSPAKDDVEDRVTRKQKQPMPNNDHLPNLSISDEDPMVDRPLTEEVLSKALGTTQDAFNDLGEARDALQLSNKMKALMKIIELSEIAGDKVLVFSHRHATLDYVGNQLRKLSKSFSRIDGKTPPQKRQKITKSFNEGSIGICLISTRAGGQGLNMFGANRVVILDSHFNPMWEQQAVGRAYRIGQKKHVFVYRLTAAGTFEEEMQNQALFKEQLATRVLEKKNPHRIGVSGARQYLFAPKKVKKCDIACFMKKDPLVLDHLLMDEEGTPITSIVPSETFYIDDGQDLTAQEYKEAQQMLQDEKLRRSDPGAYYAKLHPNNVNRNAFISARTPYPSQHRPASQGYNAPSLQIPQEASSKSFMSTAPSALTDSRDLLEIKDFEESKPLVQSSWHEHGIPRVEGGPIVSTPAPGVPSEKGNVESRLADTVSNLFSSKNDLPKIRQVPKSLRAVARSDMHNLIAKKHRALPAPLDMAKKLINAIEKHSKDDTDFQRLIQAIRMLLQQDNVDPNALLQMMTDKLGNSDTFNDSSMSPSSEAMNKKGHDATNPIEVDDSDYDHGNKVSEVDEPLRKDGDQEDRASIIKSEPSTVLDNSESQPLDLEALDVPMLDKENEGNSPVAAAAAADHHVEAETNGMKELSGLASTPDSPRERHTTPVAASTEPKRQTQEGKRSHEGTDDEIPKKKNRSRPTR